MNKAFTRLFLIWLTYETHKASLPLIAPFALCGPVAVFGQLGHVKYEASPIPRLGSAVGRDRIHSLQSTGHWVAFPTSWLTSKMARSASCHSIHLVSQKGIYGLQILVGTIYWDCPSSFSTLSCPHPWHQSRWKKEQSCYHYKLHMQAVTSQQASCSALQWKFSAP